jgi:hypothetical protein
MRTKNVWRLKESPTTTDVLELVNAGLITKEEAKDILFTQQTEEDRDKKSLQSEIKFLRELVERLSNQTKTVEIIREIQKPYQQWGWYRPYEIWCGTTYVGTASTTTNGTNTLTALSYNGINGTATNGTAYVTSPPIVGLNKATTDVQSFSSIKTF